MGAALAAQESAVYGGGSLHSGSGDRRQYGRLQHCGRGPAAAVSVRCGRPAGADRREHHQPQLDRCAGQGLPALGRPERPFRKDRAVHPGHRHVDGRRRAGTGHCRALAGTVSAARCNGAAGPDARRIRRRGRIAKCRGAQRPAVAAALPRRPGGDRPLHYDFRRGLHDCRRDAAGFRVSLFRGRTVDAAATDADLALASGDGPPRAGVSVAQARSALEIVAHQMEQEAPKDRAALEDRGDAVERGAGGEVPADADLRAGRGRSGDVDRLRGCGRPAVEPRGTAAEGDRDSRFAGRRVVADRAAVAVREPGAGGDGEPGGNRGGAIAVAASDEAAGALPIVLPHLQRVSLNGRVLAFNAVLCLLLAVVCSLAPILLAARTDLQSP